MTFTDFLITGVVAVVCGLDRMALFQVMISRPIVAGSAAGFVLGEPWLGLQIGMLSELLWLGRLPVGATIPPDDTQMAVGGTFLAVYSTAALPYSEPVIIALSLLIAMPLAKSGRVCDRMARRANDNLSRRAERFLQAGEMKSVEHSHLFGVLHFAVASLTTYVVVAGIGSLLCQALIPLLAAYCEPAGYWLLLPFPLVGTAMMLRSIKINHSATLFSASFISGLLILWLL